MNVISSEGFNVKLGSPRPARDRSANRGCVCVIYNSRSGFFYFRANFFRTRAKRFRANEQLC